MDELSVLFATVGSEEEASKIARALVDEKLVACVNIVPRIRSIYSWKGEVCDDEEYLLVMKSRSSRFPAVEQRIRELHSYEVPEVIAFPIAQGLPEYLDWVVENTRTGDDVEGP